jgi:hypothetical protein
MEVEGSTKKNHVVHEEGVILTKDNLAKHSSWGGSKQCSFCLHDETIQHLFFIAIMLDFFGD